MKLHLLYNGMRVMVDKEILKALEEVVLETLEKVGLDTFKKTSLFLSNQKR